MCWITQIVKFLSLKYISFIIALILVTTCIILYWITPENSQFSKRFPMFLFQNGLMIKAINIVKILVIIPELFIKLALRTKKLHTQSLNRCGSAWNKCGRRTWNICNFLINGKSCCSQGRGIVLKTLNKSNQLSQLRQLSYNNWYNIALCNSIPKEGSNNWVMWLFQIWSY